MPVTYNSWQMNNLQQSKRFNIHIRLWWKIKIWLSTIIRQNINGSFIFPIQRIHNIPTIYSIDAYSCLPYETYGKPNNFTKYCISLQNIIQCLEMVAQSSDFSNIIICRKYHRHKNKEKRLNEISYKNVINFWGNMKVFWVYDILDE